MSYISGGILLFLALGMSSCSHVARSELEGLWQLERVEVDGWERKTELTLLKMEHNSSFAISRASGDFTGIYHLRSGVLRFISEDDRWYAMDWRVSVLHDRLRLRGIPYGYGNTYLTFRRLREVPDFSAFENRVSGKWQLYKIRKKGEVERLSDTWFYIDTSGHYRIKRPEGVEQGKATIDSRHQKIIFVGQDIQWKAWFYGEELRLTHATLGLEYSLRKH